MVMNRLILAKIATMLSFVDRVLVLYRVRSIREFTLRAIMTPRLVTSTTAKLFVLNNRSMRTSAL